MRKSTKSLIVATTATLAALYAYNKFVETSSVRNNLLKTEKGSYYNWKQGRIFYQKCGKGKPIILVHDLDTRASSEEWSKIVKKLSKERTVYTLDLLGCGRSDKPALQYTNYMYVQLISNFAKEIVKEKADIVATNISSSFVIMANNLDNTLFDKIILVNPVSVNQMSAIPNKNSKLKLAIIHLPIIGTFIYNRLMSPIKIDFKFKKDYFSKSQLINSNLKDTYYESAHLDRSNGKYLYSSILTNYTNINIEHAIKKIDKPVYIIGSREIDGNIAIMDNYHKLNNNIEITHISNCQLYPQLEIPTKFLKVLENEIK